MTQLKLNGKVAFITGANSGIGAVTAKELALQGYHVFLACRDRNKADQVIQEISAESHGQAQVESLELALVPADDFHRTNR